MSSPTSFRIDDDYGYPFSRRIISRASLDPFAAGLFIVSQREKIFTHDSYNRNSRPWKRAIISSHFPQNFRSARDLKSRSICIFWRKGIQEANVLKIQHKCLHPFSAKNINSTLYSTVTRLIWSGILCNTSTQWYDYYSRIMRVTAAFINI